ncbi:hypothetical protein DMA12_18380 [Amycolatopsis balhimycina DSM 5908]|uniref:Uncharacterized protein n=1 Tax=Amycolatopsis balhimycina DSM 5908 TaxID=1081091 RepID=A0A428WLC2_AMYBA|nr:hypothetical protein [Amycolatopsis balhimycina]RSM43832.1 hypothetical protein DMA12_18380 [Amycolatopsis balhimycina DSM 5908]
MEYTVKRVDLGGRQTILIREKRSHEPFEVLADRSVPAREIDAHVRAALIRELVDRRQPEDPAASA